jgi:hypothetical protein
MNVWNALVWTAGIISPFVHSKAMYLTILGVFLESGNVVESTALMKPN